MIQIICYFFIYFHFRLKDERHYKKMEVIKLESLKFMMMEPIADKLFGSFVKICMHGFKDYFKVQTQDLRFNNIYRYGGQGLILKDLKLLNRIWYYNCFILSKDGPILLGLFYMSKHDTPSRYQV